jgi:hypothetical protein
LILTDYQKNVSTNGLLKKLPKKMSVLMDYQKNVDTDELPKNISINELPKKISGYQKNIMT